MPAQTTSPYYGNGRVTYVPTPMDTRALAAVNRAKGKALAAERIRPPRTRWTLDRTAIPGRGVR